MSFEAINSVVQAEAEAKAAVAAAEAKARQMVSDAQAAGRAAVEAAGDKADSTLAELRRKADEDAMGKAAILSKQTKHSGFGKRTEDLFMNFMDLLPQHFVREHGIEFYADALNVTPTYLSRAVRQVSGRTVMEYINRLLLMEAIWLLESTDLSIDEIAERINYADSTTFGRFFFRMKGVTPREYRKSL